jgi:hypothetical protein
MFVCFIFLTTTTLFYPNIKLKHVVFVLIILKFLLSLSSYRCVTDIPDECATNNGGCWHTTAAVKGKNTEFSACHDNLDIYKDALAHGQPVDTISLHTCQCPPCFSAVEKRGKITCQARCNLDYCDLDAGVCHAEPGAGSLNAGSIAAIVICVVAVVAGGGFVAYRLFMKCLMQSEIRAIMAQYMPLGDSDVGEGRGLIPMGNGNSSNGGGGV